MAINIEEDAALYGVNDGDIIITKEAEEIALLYDRLLPNSKAAVSEMVHLLADRDKALSRRWRVDLESGNIRIIGRSGK